MDEMKVLDGELKEQHAGKTEKSIRGEGRGRAALLLQSQPGAGMDPLIEGGGLCAPSSADAPQHKGVWWGANDRPR